MIHVDTNLLIASIDPSHEHARVWTRLVMVDEPIAASAVAWTEFRSYSISSNQLLAVEQLLLGGIVAYERAHADLAGELFRKTKTKRKNRLDSMIAATAILAGAKLATLDQRDFQPLVSLGLELHQF
jgi:predicted nucleic acid-binding protein